jgi:hypothetical protein
MEKSPRRKQAGRSRALYLQKAADLREPVVLTIRVERVFDFMRRDARFGALERRIGLLE